MTSKSFTEFVVVRYGQSEANSTGTLQGQQDSPLAPVGRRQAEAVALRLAAEPFDAVCSSDLTRARETAETILRARQAAGCPPLKLELEPELREWALGDLEGMTIAEVAEKYPEVYRVFFSEPEELEVPGGESKLQFEGRVRGVMTRLAETRPGRRILLVSHGGVLQRLLRLTAGPIAAGNRMSLSENCSVNIFRRYPDSWQMVTWNECAHLRAVGTKPTLAL